MNHSAASESGLTASAHGMKSHAMALVCGLALAAAGSASATTLMDQIGPSASHQQGLSNNLAQISTFYRHAAHYNASVIDDFTLADPAALSGVEAAFFAFSIRGLDGWDQLTGIRVNIFDTQPNLAMNYQLGNLFSADIPWWNIGFVSPWTTDPMTRLASIDLSGYQLTLPAGTYWLAVMALADGYSTDIGILMSSFRARSPLPNQSPLPTCRALS